ncbi:MAG TPA: hypothetical protein VFN68_12935 [Acidimicrobiales bacterium]|nr:hypothetical protein [Acidimicrobiales bacterium]
MELEVDAVQVQFCASTGVATYSFRCPACGVVVNKEANDAIVESLTSAGARMLVWTLPAELAEPKVGPRITHDDLLEFHLGLEGDDWRRELDYLTPRG